MDLGTAHIFRPKVSERNYTLVQKLTHNSVNHPFDESLSELIKKFQKISKRSQKS